MFPPKMDGENNGSKPYEQMDDLGGFPPIFGNTHIGLGRMQGKGSACSLKEKAIQNGVSIVKAC